jgi:alginate O-acetyltransferase complex protein AlgJ
MEAVAARLARFIDRRWPGSLPTTEYRVEQIEVQQTGDIVPMLDLPEGQRLYPPESVWLRRIVNADGTAWRSSRDAEVLVLGDSFSNIYSLESMGWGTSAGFVEQLSYALRRPVDRIVQNDQGAFATRELLARGTSRLTNTRVVVYQFAERELAFGDWKILPLE